MKNLFEKLDKEINSGIIVIDRDQKILHVNGVVENIFGYTKDELLLRDVSILLPEEIRHKHKSYVDEFIHSKINDTYLNRPIAGRSKTGEQLFLHLALSKIKLLNEYYVALIQDSTKFDRKIQELIDKLDRLEKMQWKQQR